MQEAHLFPISNPSAVDAVFSPDSRRLAIPRAGDEIEIWTFGSATFEVLLTNDHPKNAASPEMVFSGDGKHLASLYHATEEKPAKISFWDLEARSEKVIATLQPAEIAMFIGMSRDADRLTTITATVVRKHRTLDHLSGYRFARWRLPSGERESGADLQPNCRVTVLSRDGTYALAAKNFPARPEPRYLVGVEGGSVLWSKDLQDFSEFTDDSRSVLGFDGKKVLEIDVETGVERLLLEIRPDDVQGSESFSVSPDRKLLAICGYASSTVTIFDTKTRRKLDEFEYCPPDYLRGMIAFSPDGHYLLTTTGYVGHGDKPKKPMLRLWRVPDAWKKTAP
jgi:WD40 repeat protein